ncbi:S9 family peptidase [Xanthomonas nasturtii]|uniref:S9 family peptidase n=1 Tax=Xanthomonas nasturtii TaxID=1843581 RepID=A0A3E1KEX7_9XANT|nr:S9 family peptidase [Xanthomonas nasturtii]MCL1532260.1 S9 family peptidase [Xanthomonas nasturtii]MCL1561464.1 S9 family peptidase [Xanthomonas nasturtii]MCL1566973.1 S9 family peptidase [Xanthomonas nasturtii]MCL1570904.1 S9 family peptidase [Xanthomonas nasturtii]MCL1574696.1 S9 family peptidase [Xanthomonas nasturtii]
MGVGCVLALVAAMPAQAQEVLELTPYLKSDQIERIKISPTGDYFALTMPMEDRTVLGIVRRKDKVATAKVTGGANSVVDDFWWASDERMVVSMAQRLGSRDEPMAIGQLHAIDADGKNSRLLASPYGTNPDINGAQLKMDLDPGTYMLDTLPGDARNILVSTIPFVGDPNVRVDKLDIQTGRRSTVATAPVQRADFVTDQQGRIRFASGADVTNTSKLYYRDNDDAPWRLINDAGSSKHREFPLGFSADGSVAYLQVEQDTGTDVLAAWDPATGKSTPLLHDDTVDPDRILRDLDGITPIGAAYMSDRVRNRFFDEQTPTAKLYRSLEKAFDGNAVYITSATRDRRLVLVYVWSDRNNGDYYLFDTVSKHADRVFSRREWFPPDAVPASTQVSFKARDGLQLHGYLTRPLHADAGKPLPLIVMPHGGPFGIFDKWEFDDDAQLLAAAGYAVLRVNYRGSANYGRAFTVAGAKEWGGRMQDDLTDATRWAITQGVADAARICLYGASYGGYAALMGVAKEPGLYRCAAGYVGVYDLDMLARDNGRYARWAKNWTGDWLGARETLAARSPVTLANQIKVPVFLAAGGKDERAPIEHTKRMERALKGAGVPVESLYFPNEGHGFYTEPHRREYYTRLLAFLSKQLGGSTAK